MYRYLAVRSDLSHSGSVPTDVVVDCLDSMPGLRKTDLVFYEAEGGLGRVHVTIAACDSAGNYAAHRGRAPQRANLVELVCCSADGLRAAQALATRIADTLGWEVVDTEADDAPDRGRPAGDSR
ncbi:hypothetical protein [Streptomyces sp. NPDC001880]